MRNGFTLIELLVVLLIVSLASVWVIPRMAQPLGGVEVKTTAKHVLSSFRYARNLAVARKMYLTAHFDMKQGRLTMFGNNPFVPGTDPAAFGQEGEQRAQVLETYDIPDNIEIEPIDTLMARNADDVFEVRFYPSGRSSGGKIIFSGRSKKQFMVHVDFITGMARLSRVE